MVWVICLGPLTHLLYQLQTDDLGANPIRYVTHKLGDATLRILMVCLSLTPIRLLFGMAWQMMLRRLLGLFVFFYVSLHFSVWIALDHFFNGKRLLTDIIKRPYITVGMLGLILLVPLAVTSTSWMMKRLGGKNWRRLHKLVYVVGVLGVLHYLWLVKKGVNTPFGYAAVLIVLLGIRIWNWAKRRHASRTSSSALTVG